MPKPTPRTRIFWQAAQRMRNAGITVDTDPSYSTVSIDAQGKNRFSCKVTKPIHSLPSVKNCGPVIHLSRWMSLNWRSPNHIQTFGVNPCTHTKQKPANRAPCRFVSSGFTILILTHHGTANVAMGKCPIGQPGTNSQARWSYRKIGA